MASDALALSLGPARRPAPALGAAGALAAATAEVRAALSRAAAVAAAEGMPELALRGQMIRPLVAFAVAQPTGGAQLSERFWFGVLALQMAHEASLVHDDIVDGAGTRRGEATLAASRGVGAALVFGDHLLTSAYRMAARTGSVRFVDSFARAVERTVAGEMAQGRSVGQEIGFDRYRDIAVGKAGELLGCALAAGPLIGGWDDTPALYALGQRIGLLYQMLDDLLDYCPAADTGKPALGDFRQRRWTWPLSELRDARFDQEPEAVVAALVAGGEAGALRRCLRRLEGDAAELRRALDGAMGHSPVLDELLREWLERAREAVERQEAAAPRPSPPPAIGRALRSRVPGPEAVAAYLGRHSRSFQFASRLFPRAQREQVARVYAFCRVTDDLVDRPEPGAAAGEMLAEWMALAARAYRGEGSGLPFLDQVMGEAAAAGVPLAHAEELAEGMRMDLRGESYRSLPELRVYTYRVASVVGLWLCGLFGVRDPWALERAAAMGHAMQLTNILRDVGEDARQGRVYLPLDRMERHGISPAELGRMARERAAPTEPYRALVEELLRVAEADYVRAFAAIPCLPDAAQRPVAVAAFVYRGIHAEIRRRGYDNLHQRATTATTTKLMLATQALRELQGARQALSRGPAGGTA